ncbi:MAG: plasmid stabilization protein [Candidatus Nealsonbacteria bacterium]
MPKINKSHTSSYFENKFRKLPKDIQKIAQRKILLFEENFLHPSLNVHKLKGALSHFWAFSITKNYRVLFRFLKNNEIIYYDIDTHNIYR